MTRAPILPAALLVLFAVPAAPQGATVSAGVAERAKLPGPRSGYTLVDRAFTFSEPSFGDLPNGATHAQDVLISHGPWQFMAYWNADRHVAVARRRLPSGPWQRLVLEDYTIPGEDSHNAVVLGLCAGDGTLHLAFDHHSDDLNYRRSVPGLAFDPASFEWDAALFGPVEDVLDPAHGTVTKLTYPRFVQAPGGDLQFVYREFGSGNGRQRLVDYDAATGLWSNDRVFIERTGPWSDPLGGASSSRNPYFNRIAYDDRGTLHATWTWREKAPIPYNRDIAYAYSEDRGATWYSGDDVLVADTAAGGFIDHLSAGINPVPIGAKWGLMNDQGHVVDGRGRVHVVMYHKDEPDDVVSYGSGWNSHYYHYWRDADRSWHLSPLGTIGSRPKLFADDHGRLFLAYQSGGDLRVDVATPESDYQDWSTAYAFESKFGDADFGNSAQGDYVAFDGYGILTIALQDRATVLGEPTNIGVVDIVLEFDEGCGMIDQVCATEHVLATERDTFVRGGAFVQDVYGTEDVVSVGAADTEEDTRLGFQRFLLSDLIGGGPLTSAELRLPVANAGSAWAQATVEARRCALDTWSEATTNWDNRPLPNGPAYTGLGGGDVLTIDVTAAIADELAAGGQRITFELAGVDPAPDHAVDLEARETGGGATLVVQQANALAPVADAYVRSGAFADVNYGAADRLIVKEDSPADFDRVAYLRFDLGALGGTGTLERVFLVAHALTEGDLARTTPYFVHPVTDDGWDELGVTWNDAPTLGAAQAAHYGRDELRWDVTDLVLAELAGDGQLSLALASDRPGASRIVHLASREHASPELRPYLLLRYASPGGP